MAMASASLSSSLVSARPSGACRQLAFSPLPMRCTHSRVSRARSVSVRSMLSEDQAKTGDKKKKKFITRDEEPEQYWQTEAERDGRNPMQSILPYIALLGLFTPFAILGLAFANGWIEPR